ncbi:metallophosphoesterase [Caldalkalibacillus salinus]|uniref:metallophosphoesterase n=1 Tax=Caldalkalibacillus salinus TaxID=2803787 RepID=UPI0019213254|nr:metallophosphoesterase [Caldalkalibacillus salinus]
MLLTSLLTLAGVSVLSKAYWNTYRPELKHVNVPVSPSKQLSKPLNILQLTDLHVEKLCVTPEKIKDLIGSETIDMIALTGDYLDRVQSIDRFMNFLSEILDIPTRYGVYAVWGNHDWIISEHLPHLKKRMEALGVNVLENEAHTLSVDGTPVHIIGIDDHYSGHSNIRQAFAEVPEVGVRFILTHDPLIVKQLPHHFDYLICGHFHSGQIYYPLPVHSLKMGLKPLKKYLCGIQEDTKRKYYISGGLGQTGANLRLGCRPEITIHTLHPDEHTETGISKKDYIA